MYASKDQPCLPIRKFVAKFGNGHVRGYASAQLHRKKIKELRQCAERELDPAPSDPRLQFPVPDEEGSASFDRFTQRDSAWHVEFPGEEPARLGDASGPENRH